MICRRCQRPRRIANRKRWLCAGCDRNLSPAERAAWAPVLPPLERRPARVSKYQHLRSEVRHEMFRLFQRGYSRSAIAKAFGASKTSVHNAVVWAETAS